jgi:alpha-beta hydrolase superfamily lysophospholipase
MRPRKGAAAMTDTIKPTIVLIPGLWETSLAWEHWVDRYHAQGFEVIARSWPGMDGKTVEELRADTSSYANLGIREIVDAYADLITSLSEAPIIMGHSFGGAIAELLLDRGLGRVGVAIAPAPLKGIYLLPFSSLKSSFPILKSPANNHKAVMLTHEQFHYGFTNTMSDEDSRRAYERYAVPGPGHVLFQAAFANFVPHAAAAVDYHNPDRAPLLLIGGSIDHTVPASVTRNTAKLQHKSTALTAYKEFEGRNHFTLGQPGWEQVADFALAWALAPVELA